MHRKCYLIAAQELFDMHDMYDQLIESLDKNVIRLRIDLQPPEARQKSLQEAATASDLGKILLPKVDHPLNAHGICLITLAGQKIVYSGDTRPAEELIRLGKNADVLIHEATFENSLQDEAIKKRHSTVAEAVHVGNQMKAKTTVLTHFSARYPKIPPITDEIRNNSVGLAFDNMRFRLSEAGELPKLVPALETAFSKDQEKEDTSE